ncbi:MAG: hypothetical protein NPIRA05_09300 [Nitrospirales bacterium]|nr:MAG: hypothetical protein NPIRA05_09300 [Nitrospirales bacterium]
MRPTSHTSSIILILGILFLISAGCGKKHLHVSTMSGSPGEEEVAMDLDTSDDQSGMEHSGLDEAGLGNQEVNNTASSTNDLEPLDFTHDVAPLEQASDSQSENDLFAGLDDGTPSSDNHGQGFEDPGQEIQSQSPSFDDGLADSSLSNSASDDLPPLVAFDTPNDSGTSAFGDHNGESALPIEKMPGNIAVAKANPSDTFGEQFKKIKAEEAATLAAGLTDVFFEFDSWTLTSEGRHALEQGAEWLQETNTAKLLVEGHCDTRGTQAYNLVLGKKRAGAIRDYLVELGVTPERVSIISYGQDKPFCSDSTEVCYQLNRRGHLLVQNP